MDLCRIVYSNLEDPLAITSKRTTHRDSQTESIVAAIIEDVRTRGDLALLENARKFDSPFLESIQVSEQELEESSVSEEFAFAIRQSISRVRQFHESQRAALTSGMVPFSNGFGWGNSVPGEFAEGSLGQRMVPLSAAGVYVPGGRASYPSSVIMNATPALVAGVGEVAITTPVASDGSLLPAVLFAMRALGIQRAFKIGGAAAIAALALGTETVPRVDKIVGPGNRFVNEAKKQLWGQVGLDGYAGPSEVCVVVDDHANCAWAAADLLTQIEHAPDNAGFLIALSEAKLKEVLAEVEKQLQGAPREGIMRLALKNESLAIVARDLEHACEIINAIAPEHLTLSVRNPESILHKIQNAGCVLLGDYTPESAGDFAAGPSHTLPTSRAARFGSPVNVLDFWKVQSVIHMSEQQLAEVSRTIEAFGEMEGFPAHGAGATLRFRSEI